MGGIIREDSTNSPSTDRCHGRLPYVLNDYSPFYQERLEHHVRIGTMSNLCSTQQYGHVITQRSSRMRDLKFRSPWKQYLLVSQLSFLPLSLPFFKLRLQRGRGFRAGRSAQVELHRDDGVRRRNVMRKVAS